MFLSFILFYMRVLVKLTAIKRWLSGSIYKIHYVYVYTVVYRQHVHVHVQKHTFTHLFFGTLLF
jgi:hypothetical protein